MALIQISEIFLIYPDILDDDTLWQFVTKLWQMAMEIVSFPIIKVIFHTYVKLPDFIWNISYIQYMEHLDVYGIII